MPYVTIIAVIHPAQDKVDVVRSHLEHMAAMVEKNEQRGALRYEVTEGKPTASGEGDTEFVVIEDYRNEEAFKDHNETQYFKDLLQKLQGENLLSKPAAQGGLEIKKLTKIAGFSIS